MKPTHLGSLVATAALILLGGCTIPRQDAPNAAPAERAVAAQEQEGVIELEWQAPEQRLDGAPLQPTDIAGYRIYVGEAPGRHSRTIEVDDPTQTHYLLRGLEPGQEYFVAITTVDREGRESPKSDEITMAAAPLTDSQFARPEAQERRQDQRASLE